jgi:hypothetical protein
MPPSRARTELDDALFDRRRDGCEAPEHLIARESHHYDTEPLECQAPLLVASRNLAPIVDYSVDLDGQTRLRAEEVRDEGADPVLASELGACYLAAPQRAPEHGLGARWVPTLVAGSAQELLGVHGANASARLSQVMSHAPLSMRPRRQFRVECGLFADEQVPSIASPICSRPIDHVPTIAATSGARLDATA